MLRRRRYREPRLRGDRHVDLTHPLDEGGADACRRKPHQGMLGYCSVGAWSFSWQKPFLRESREIGLAFGLPRHARFAVASGEVWSSSYSSNDGRVRDDCHEPQF